MRFPFISPLHCQSLPAGHPPVLTTDGHGGGGCPVAGGHVKAFGWGEPGEVMQFKRYRDRKKEGLVPGSGGGGAEAKKEGRGADAPERKTLRKGEDSLTALDALLAQSYTQGYVDATLLIPPPSSVSSTTSPALPTSLKSLAASHPLSTAFLLGSATTLTFLTGAAITRSVLGRSLKPVAARGLQSGEGGWIAPRIDDLERRVVERVEKGSRDRRMELEMFRKEIMGQLGVIEGQLAGRAGLGAAKVISTTTPPASITPLGGKAEKVAAVPKAATVHTASTPSSMAATESGPKSAIPLGTSSSTSSAKEPKKKLYDLHFGLRQGIGKRGPMPIVDASNPNYISYADAEPPKVDIASSKPADTTKVNDPSVATTAATSARLDNDTVQSRPSKKRGDAVMWHSDALGEALKDSAPIAQGIDEARLSQVVRAAVEDVMRTGGYDASAAGVSGEVAKLKKQVAELDKKMDEGVASVNAHVDEQISNHENWIVDYTNEQMEEVHRLAHYWRSIYVSPVMPSEADFQSFENEEVDLGDWTPDDAKRGVLPPSAMTEEEVERKVEAGELMTMADIDRAVKGFKDAKAERVAAPYVGEDESAAQTPAKVMPAGTSAKDVEEAIEDASQSMTRGRTPIRVINSSAPSETQSETPKATSTARPVSSIANDVPPSSTQAKPPPTNNQRPTERKFGVDASGEWSFVIAPVNPFGVALERAGWVTRLIEVRCEKKDKQAEEGVWGWVKANMHQTREWTTTTQVFCFPDPDLVRLDGSIWRIEKRGHGYVIREKVGEVGEDGWEL